MAVMKPGDASPWPAKAWTARPVVRTAPTQTTNMTGLRTWRRGESFHAASRSTSPHGIVAGDACVSGRRGRGRSIAVLPGGSADHAQVLDEGAERERGDERQGADQEHGRDEQDHEERT